MEQAKSEPSAVFTRHHAFNKSHEDGPSMLAVAERVPAERVLQEASDILAAVRDLLIEMSETLDPKPYAAWQLVQLAKAFIDSVEIPASQP